MPLKIFYLDDEQILLDNFVDIFASKSVHITTFAEPSEAIAAIKKTPPDLIFLDYRLPGTTGHAVALQLDPTIPKALITGDLSVQQDSIFEVIFEKPMDIKAITAYIESHHRKRHE